MELISKHPANYNVNLTVQHVIRATIQLTVSQFLISCHILHIVLLLHKSQLVTQHYIDVMCTHSPSSTMDVKWAAQVHL